MPATLQSPAPMPGFPKDLETHLVYGQMTQMSSLCSPQVSDERECRQLVLYHVTSQTGHSPHLCDMMAREVPCYRGCRTDRQNETSATASRFSFRVFWTFSFQHGFWKGSSSALCLRDRRGKTKPRFKGYLNFGQSYSVL